VFGVGGGGGGGLCWGGCVRVLWGVWVRVKKKRGVYFGGLVLVGSTPGTAFAPRRSTPRGERQTMAESKKGQRKDAGTKFD